MTRSRIFNLGRSLISRHITNNLPSYKTNRYFQTAIVSSKLPSPVGPYSSAIAVGNTLYVSGAIPLRLKNSGEVEDCTNQSIEQQTAVCLDNIKHILTSSGVSLSDVVKVTVLLTDMKNFDKVNKIYSEYFKFSPAPARSCFAVKELPKNASVEIECIANLSKK